MESNETPKAETQVKPFKAFATEAEFNSYVQDLQAQSDAQKQFEKLKTQNEKMKNDFENLKNEKLQVENNFQTFKKESVFNLKTSKFLSNVRDDIPQPLIDTYIEKVKNEALASDDLEAFDFESRFEHILKKETDAPAPAPEKKGTGVPSEKVQSSKGYEGISDPLDLYDKLIAENPKLKGTKELHLKMQKLRMELNI